MKWETDMNSTDKNWEKFGRQDPYFGVLSHDEYKKSKNNSINSEQFFATGQSHVDACLSIIRSYLKPSFSPKRAVDFGCGVGRVAAPMGRIVEEVVAVDVSESMLREAEGNFLRAGLTNIKTALSDDDLSNLNGSFDFIHSFIVFQHIPVLRGEKILSGLVERLSEGGIGAIHLTYGAKASLLRLIARSARKNIPLFINLENILRRRAFSYPAMQMNNYKLDKIFSLLQDRGCHKIHMRFSEHSGHLGVFIFFEKKTENLF